MLAAVAVRRPALRSASAFTFASQSTASLFSTAPISSIFGGDLASTNGSRVLWFQLGLTANVCLYFLVWQIELYLIEQMSSNWFLFAGFRRSRLHEEPGGEPSDVTTWLQATALAKRFEATTPFFFYSAQSSRGSLWVYTYNPLARTDTSDFMDFTFSFLTFRLADCHSRHRNH